MPNKNCTNEIRLRHDLRVPMRDGVQLSADVYHPREGTAFPTIVTRTPYESGRDVFIDLGVWWAEQGYAFVVEDCRGRFESEGTFHAYFPDVEDGYDTMEWVVQQPWCNGKIGTWGRSYGGLTQWLSAPLQSPHVTCMTPHVICDDFFSDCHYIGGAFQLLLSLGAAVIWETNLATVIGKQSGKIFQNPKFWRHLPLIEMDEIAIGRQIPYWREWLEHPVYSEYWTRCDTVGKHQNIVFPAFQQCGWLDPYAGAGFRNFNSMRSDSPSSRAREQQRIIVGPWSHEEPDSPRMGDMDFGEDSVLDIRQEELRWFDWQLRGVTDGMAQDPPIRIHVSGVNEWRWAEQWPLPNVSMQPFYLHSQGQANRDLEDGSLNQDPPGSEPPDQFDYDPQDPVPTTGGVISVRLITQHAQTKLDGGPVDQSGIEQRADVLVYTSEALKHPLTVIGPVDLVLYAESSAPDTDFTVRVNDVTEDGRSLVLTEGIIRCRYRHSRLKTELMERGEVDELRIQLCPMSHVFLPGHRLRVDISSSNFPRFSRNLNTGEDVGTGTNLAVARNTVLHQTSYPSHILLPIVEE